MLRTVFERVWAFDAEWVPDPVTGRMLYHLDDHLSNEEVMREMWRRNGATEEDPTPFLKTAVCRLVSLVLVERWQKSPGDVRLRLRSLPETPDDPSKTTEEQIIRPFLTGVGRFRPQVVGFNSVNADLKILIQRGIALGIQAKEFCRRPAKPWEGEDYFARGTDCNIDLMEVVCGFGRTYSVTLNEIAVVSGIPGKLGTSGDDVAGMWINGKLQEIIEYNEYDAFTTYLLWLRVANFAGLFSPDEYAQEQALVENLLEHLISEGKAHLTLFLSEWKRLRSYRINHASAIRELHD